MQTWPKGIDTRELKRIVTHALAEDLGKGDITSESTIPDDVAGEMAFVACESMTVAGLFFARAVYDELGEIEIETLTDEGATVAAETPLLRMRGSARILLSGERVALNLMQRASGIATLTQHYVRTVKGTNAVILDTRKTMPGLRLLDKYAVRAGGGQNHRMRLDDMVLIKDNHIVVCGGIQKAVQRARKATNLPVEVECDTLVQVKEAMLAEADRILLDNMAPNMLKEAVAIVKGSIPLEASGGISLENVRIVAETGVDFISVGKLTHSAVASDIRADMKL